MRARRWRLHPADPARADALARTLGIHPLTAQLLLNRGVADGREASRFLRPGVESLSDPLQLPDMARAVARIRRAIARREPILLFGDSDTDGLTAGAILYETLRELGAVVRARQSNRIAAGYGLPLPLVRSIIRSAIRLLIVVDCGTNQREAIAQLAAHGIDTIVVDHHVPLEGWAQPMALINPHGGEGSGRPACHGEHGAGRELCSAGLAFKVAQGLFEGRRERLEAYLDLAALGTLADCSPLIGDSRHLVSAGISRIVDSRRLGLRRLCEATGTTRPDPEQVVKRLVPRLNASGRLGEATRVWRLLLADGDADDVDDCLAAAAFAHTTLKQYHRRVIGEAQEQVNQLHFRDACVLVVSQRGWPQGIMGLLAAQLAERYGRPAIAIALNDRRGVGSGRSVPEVNLLELLQQCRESLVQFGGHAQACGLTVEAKDLERFREQVNHHARNRWPRERLVPEATMDLELPLAAIHPTWVGELIRLAPFGRGNPRPSLVVRDVVVERISPRRGWVRHGPLRVALRGRLPEATPQMRYDVAGTPSVEEGTLVLTLTDARDGEARGEPDQTASTLHRRGSASPCHW